MTEKNVEALLLEQRRRLELEHLQQLSAILSEMKNTFGDGVIDVVHKVHKEYFTHKWSCIAQKNGSNTIEELIRILAEPLLPQGLEYTMEEKAEGIQLHFTKCPFHELIKGTGLEEWGYHLVCHNDHYITEGFNPKMGFKRTKTLVQGHDCCDHFYYIKEEK